MSYDRSKTSAALDRIALGFVAAGLVVFGIIALSNVVHLSTLYPGVMAAFGLTVVFAWSLWRVLKRYRT